MLKQGTGKPCSYIMASLSPCFLVFDEEMEKKMLCFYFTFVFKCHADHDTLFCDKTWNEGKTYVNNYHAHSKKKRRVMSGAAGFWQIRLEIKMWPNTQPHSALSQQRVMGGITIICPGQQMILLPPSAHPSYLRSTWIKHGQGKMLLIWDVSMVKKLQLALEAPCFLYIRNECAIFHQSSAEFLHTLPR